MTTAPYFLEGPNGRLFMLRFGAGATGGREALVVPPFAEEMNKARKMMAGLGRALAAQRVSTSLLDLLGTGDSEGEFQDADWTRWQHDLGAGCDHLASRGAERVTLVACRLGALLAIAHLQRRGVSPVDQLVLWQPVLQGRQFVQQFLRLRLAADFMGQQGAGAKVSDLRAALASEGRLEVAGYILSEALVAGIEASAYDATTLGALARGVHWFEVGAAGKPLSPVAERIANEWRDAGVSVSTEVVTGEPFWATQEIATVPELIRRTVAAVTGADSAE